MVKEEYHMSLKKMRFMIGLNPENEIPKIFYIAKKKGFNFDIRTNRKAIKFYLILNLLDGFP